MADKGQAGSGLPFWSTTPLNEMSVSQWERLCDGCAKCCLHKLEDEDSGEIHYTNVACRLLDPSTNRCTGYAERSALVSCCLVLTPQVLADPSWLPATCAYRRLVESKELPDWHPLVSGDSKTVVTSGNSVLGRAVPEQDADDWEHHLIDWVE